jgi:hypothetical protein
VSAPVVEALPRSAECTLAQRPGYKGLHRDCRQTKDIPLPHASGILLQRRCGCTCHPWARRTS